MCVRLLQILISIQLDSENIFEKNLSQITFAGNYYDNGNLY